MCPDNKILSQSKNGLLSFSPNSKLFQLIFNNLCFELYEWELEKFKKYLWGLDVTYWELQLKSWVAPRKIPVEVGNKHLIVMVNKNELDELKTLLTGNNKLQLLTYKDIDYSFIEN